MDDPVGEEKEIWLLEADVTSRVSLEEGLVKPSSELRPVRGGWLLEDGWVYDRPELLSKATKNETIRITHLTYIIYKVLPMI